MYSWLASYVIAAMLDDLTKDFPYLKCKFHRTWRTFHSSLTSMGMVATHQSANVYVSYDMKVIYLLFTRDLL